jgi:hypothetical protein
MFSLYPKKGKFSTPMGTAEATGQVVLPDMYTRSSLARTEAELSASYASNYGKNAGAPLGAQPMGMFSRLFGMFGDTQSKVSVTKGKGVPNPTPGAYQES